MGKKEYYQQKSIEDARDAENIYENDHFEEFFQLLIDELLFYIKDIPYKTFINNDLPFMYFKRKFMRVHSLSWSYKVDQRLINDWMVYSFRFPNVCHSDFYRIFDIRAHHLFQKSPKRHHSNDWYEYIGKQLGKYIGKYLKIERFNQGQNLYTTELFVNQKEERLDIIFRFTSIATKVTITFEPPIFISS